MLLACCGKKNPTNQPVDLMCVGSFFYFFNFFFFNPQTLSESGQELGRNVGCVVFFALLHKTYVR